DPRLARRIRDAAPAALHAGDRSGAADRAPRLTQRSDRRMGEAERTDQVRVEDGLPEILAQTVELGKRDRRRGGGRPGVVDEKIEAAARVDGAAPPCFLLGPV